jgi:uncharacterized protein (DUF58 family)
MLTRRGWWLFAIAGILCLGAIAVNAPALLLTTMTLLTWFLAGWIGFSWRTRSFPRGLEIQREMHTSAGPTTVLWARRPVTVRVELYWTGGGRLPFAAVVDRVPILVRWLDGDVWAGAGVDAQTPIVIEYRVEPRAAGRLRFDGLRVTVSDLCGFFHQTAFIRDPVRIRVLPPMAEPANALPRKKLLNRLPILGNHRYLRPGSGSELLDLRDYVESDPPKLIAWKASARRDRLIVKELESDVPVRSTLIVDMSSSVRVGPVGDHALARLVEIAAALLQANHRSRDPTGLTLVGDSAVERVIRPARGRRAYFELLHLLVDVADAPPRHAGDLEALVHAGMGLAYDLYPDQLDPEVNSAPLLAVGLWFRARWMRKKLAAILAHQHRLGPGGIMLLYRDDVLFRDHLDRWLAEHRVAVPTMLYDEAGHYRFRSPQKPALFADALLRGVAHGRDNELFVLLADLLDQGADLDPLMRAVKVALARHHQVQIVCPWPPGVPLPGETAKPSTAPPRLQELLHRAFAGRLHGDFAELKRKFAGLGVTVLAAASDKTVAAILERLQRLRVGGRR